MNDIGKVGGNAFTPIDRMVDLSDEEIMENAASHPAFGFKCDLIRLIASLVYRHRANQDQVSCLDMLILLLFKCLLLKILGNFQYGMFL